jgi:hypothetical protein
VARSARSQLVLNLTVIIGGRHVRRSANQEAIRQDAADSRSSETAEFVRAILGKSGPGEGSELYPSGSRSDYLEWLAAVSTFRDRRTSKLAESERDKGAAREHLEWLADISTDHEQRLNRILREEAKAREAADREGQLREARELDEKEWDPNKHPRTGRAPNPGWFAAMGGGTGGGSGARSGAGEPDQLAQAPMPGPQPAPANPQSRWPKSNPFGTWPERRPGVRAEIRYGKDSKGNEVPERTKKPAESAISDLTGREVGRVFEEKGIAFNIAHNDQQLQMELARRRDRPLPAHTQAAYDHKTGIIHVFDQKRLPNGQLEQTKGIDHSVRHEGGHAVDHYLNNDSDSPEFQRVYARDRNRANQPGVRKDPGEENALSSRKEAYAEAFARHAEGTEQTGALPHTIEYMRQSPRINELLRPRRDR